MKELFDVIRAGDSSQVAALVAADPSLAIFAASIQGETARIEELLSANRSLVSALSSDGWTPLHLAAFFGKLEAARLLLNKGAQVNARSTNPMQNMPLHAAAAGKHSEIIKLLLDHGASANARQHGGWTPLHAVAQNGDVDSAKALLSSGADVEARADNSQRALDLALTKGQQAMVEFLEANGAKL
ncbi:MAG TPA: ankyrin repeat domain-containing protein [Bryobacteraceae bacterium]|nr:ankyrin repeat domain-containing protein [Bryobacteraceae bacterium]